MSQEQIDDTNNLDMKRDDRLDETMDSGIVTLRSCGAGAVLESMLPDTMDRIIVLDPGPVLDRDCLVMICYPRYLRHRRRHRQDRSQGPTLLANNRLTGWPT